MRVGQKRAGIIEMLQQDFGKGRGLVALLTQFQFDQDVVHVGLLGMAGVLASPGPGPVLGPVIQCVDRGATDIGIA